MPIVVQPAAILDTVEVAAPLAVGSERMRLIWSKVADDLGLEFDGDRLYAARDEVSVEVRRDLDEGRARLLGRLEFPNLGLGLRPHRERRGLLGGLATGLATRDGEQTQVVAVQLGSEIADSKYDLLTADDHQISIAFEHAGLELTPLADFAAWLVALAERVAALPSVVPMPTIMREHADTWERAAKLLGGRLRMAEPSIEFERDGLRLRLACSYDDEGQLQATELRLDPGLTIPSRLYMAWTAGSAAAGARARPTGSSLESRRGPEPTRSSFASPRTTCWCTCPRRCRIHASSMIASKRYSASDACFAANKGHIAEHETGLATAPARPASSELSLTATNQGA